MIELATLGKAFPQRLLIPILSWILVSLALIGWQYHSSRSRDARVRFAVQLAGDRLVSYEAFLNDMTFQAGQISGIGEKTLRITAYDAEPFETNFFVWYRGASLGTINLQRSRGSLDLEVAPTPNHIILRGLFATNEISDCSRKTWELPVGEYEIQCAFEQFTIRRRATVRAGQRAVVTIKPSVTALGIDSEPSSSHFRLESSGPEHVSIEGTTPATLRALPIEPYRLNIWRDDYRKTVPVNLSTDPTNLVTVRFEYATLKIISDPSGAAVDEADKLHGTTPISVSVRPGNHSFRIAKGGYLSTNLNFQITADEAREIHVTLGNIAFVEALERARSAISEVYPDYPRALSEADKALGINPNDETALRLKRSILVMQHLSEAKTFSRNGDYPGALSAIDSALSQSPNNKEALDLKADIAKAQQAAQTKKAEAEKAVAEMQRNRPREILEKITVLMPYNELFDEQTLSFTGSIDATREAIARALARNPKWSVAQNDSPDADSCIIQGAIRGLGWKQNVVLVASKTDNNAVTICFKLFQFSVANKVELTLGGFSDDSYTPVHPRNGLPKDAGIIEGRRSRAIREFRQRIEEELH